jgi:hypothetical protein
MKKIILLSFLFISLWIQAQDRLFTFTYQSNVLNKGQKEIEIWSTMRTGRDNFYQAFNHSLEFEVGLGSKLQTSFYLNYGYSKGIETTGTIQSVASENSYSFANEWKLKLTDPVANPIGSALYFEYKLGTDETELEGKLILDKMVGNSTHALNIVGEYEIEKKFVPNGDMIDVKSEGEYKLEFNYGYAYKLNKNWALGVELMNQNTISDGNWEYSVVSAGPSLSYNIEGFWVNLSVMPQITNLKTGNLEFHDNQKLQTRIIFSYVL